MVHRSKRLLAIVGLIALFGLTIGLFLYGPQLLHAAPSIQYPLDRVLIISDPAPPDPGFPGQFPEKTVVQDNFFDPSANWNDYNFNDAAWQDSYPSWTIPAWGSPFGGGSSADFIWGGTPGNNDGTGRFQIPTNPAGEQFVFIRKNFCIPLNADPASILPNTNLRVHAAATAGDTEIYYNGLTLATPFGDGDESNFYNFAIPTGGTSPFITARRRGLNTLAFRVQDTHADPYAGVAYEVEIGYTIDPSILALVGIPNPSVIGVPVNFVASLGNIGGDGPYSYTWDFGDSTTGSSAVPSTNHTYMAAGVYTVTLTATDNYGCISAPVTYVQTVLAPPLISVTISGPTVGNLNTSYDFTATVSPTNTAQPITYTWQATEQTGVVNTVNSTQNTVSFSWTIPGTKTIIVTAQNDTGPVTDTHTIYINPNALTDITISGPTTGLTGVSYGFTGDVSPTTATLPIDYTWAADSQAGSTNPGSNSYSDNVAYIWNVAGTYLITATADNAASMPVQDTHLITITDAMIPPGSITVSGPTLGLINTAYTFDADVLPTTTTLPITYNWQVTDLGGAQTLAANSLNDQQTFNWPTAGVKQLVVTATNAAGNVVGSHAITIALVPPTSLTVSGPTNGVVNVAYTFDADVLPSNTSLPITYDWTVTDLGTRQTANATSLNDQQSFTWTTAGVKQLDVTATNAAGNVVGSHVITISLLPVAPTSLTVSGPTTGFINSVYTFNADVLPLSTTTPITYDWVVTDLGTRQTAASTSLNDQQSFTWTSTGVKQLDVTATNAAGNVVGSHTITIIVNGVAPLSLTVSGPTAGVVNTAYVFDATVLPISTTTPISYNWIVTDLGTRQTAASASLTNQQSFIWASAGVKQLDVTATNAAGSVVGSHTITITVGPVAPLSLIISGPTTGITGQSYTFNATVSPNSTTVPLTYTWQATDQTNRVRTINSNIDSLAYTWNTGGIKVLTVTAANAAGSVVATYQISITVVVTAPLSVSISGPATGVTGNALTFAANVSPSDASSPLTYVWTAGGQTTLTYVNNNQVSFTWNTAGTYTISVRVSNSAGSATATINVTITDPTATPTATATASSSGNDDDDDDDDVSPTSVPPSGPTAAPTATITPTPSPNVPLFLPETGQRPQSHTERFILSGILAGLLGYILVILWRSQRR